SAVFLTGDMGPALEWARSWLTSWGIGLRATGEPLHLEANSPLPAGCIATLAASLNELGGRETSPSPDKTEHVALPTRAGRCLICDDDGQIRHIISATLEMAGHETVCFDTPAGMLAYLKGQTVDVIILDVNLGPVSGIDALKSLRALPGRAGRTPVCMLSGALDHREVATAAGANDYLLKPSGAKDLNAAVDRLLALRDEPSHSAIVS
ncbi:MAG: response regulator, partial [Gammaproteobacteria bacterium]